MAFYFQGWQVYKDARELRKDINRIIKTFPVEEKSALVEQARRAMLSVVLEIAEGSNRKTDRDKVVFVNRSLTSLNEVLACCDCALDDTYITNQEYQTLFNKIEAIAKQLKGFEKRLGQPK